MACCNIENSTLVLISIGGSPIACSNDASLTLTHSPRDTTNKDSNGYRCLLEGLRSFDMSGGALYATDAAYGLPDLATLWTNRTKLTATIGNGSNTFTGDFYINTIDWTSPGAEDNVAYSFSLNGTGEPTVSF